MEPRHIVSKEHTCAAFNTACNCQSRRSLYGSPDSELLNGHVEGALGEYNMYILFLHVNIEKSSLGEVEFLSIMMEPRYFFWGLGGR